jgi:hypothetical protein
MRQIIPASKAYFLRSRSPRLVLTQIICTHLEGEGSWRSRVESFELRHDVACRPAAQRDSGGITTQGPRLMRILLLELAVTSFL